MMKKLKLSLDQLAVTSFAAQEGNDARGTVDGLTGYAACRPSYYVTQCLHCTEAEGCYPSMYCSGNGCVVTADLGCLTANNAPC
jgi:hypothetical protein